MNHSAIEEDRRDLQRGVLVNYLAYPLKAAHPVLMVFLVRCYGAEDFGLFVAAQAVMLVLTRSCALGLDKALLWWVSQQKQGERLSGVKAAVAHALIAAVIVMSACLLAAGPISQLANIPGARPALRVMSVSLVPMVLLEIVLGMTMGTRRMGTNVVVREMVLPIGLVGAGLALWPLGWGVLGLSLAMALAYTVSLAIAVVSARSLFKDDRDPTGSWNLPPRVWHYAWPMWLAELSNTFLQRLDMWAIAALSDLRTVGIYGVAVQFGNTIRSIRRAYDPIVLAIATRIGAERDVRRLAAGYSYATAMVIGTQVPVLVFFLLFASDLLPLYGEGFSEGTAAVRILCAFWVMTSPMSLAGIVVNAYGYSRLALINVLAGSAVQASLLYWLVPAWGLDGAALAVGLTYTTVSITQTLQMRTITGGFHYRADTQRAILINIATAGVVAGGWVIAPMREALWFRGLLFASYAALYLALFLPLARNQRQT